MEKNIENRHLDKVNISTTFIEICIPVNTYFEAIKTVLVTSTIIMYDLLVINDKDATQNVNKK